MVRSVDVARHMEVSKPVSYTHLAERVVDLHLALVIHPRHAEKDLALRHGQAFKKRFLAILDVYKRQGRSR